MTNDTVCVARVPAFIVKIQLFYSLSATLDYHFQKIGQKVFPVFLKFARTFIYFQF